MSANPKIVRLKYARNKSGKKIRVRIGGKAVAKPGRKVPLATIRCKELDVYFTDRYGPVLPDDDAGRDDALIMLHHIVYRQAGDRTWLMHDWLDLRAPWLTGSEREQFIRKAFLHPIKYSADTLAKRIGLTFARRQRLGITTIGAINMDAEAREERNKEKDREQHTAKRRAAGCKPQSQSLARQEPWKAEGISRATWFRRQKSHYASDEVVSHSHCASDIPVSPIAHARIMVRAVRQIETGSSA